MDERPDILANLEKKNKETSILYKSITKEDWNNTPIQVREYISSLLDCSNLLVDLLGATYGLSDSQK